MLSKNSYASLTGLQEAALVINTDGKAFAGVHVDNSSTGLGITSLRSAFNRAAIFGGGKKIEKVMVVQSSGQKGQPSSPLSMLDPVLFEEFCRDDTKIMLSNRGSQSNFRWGDLERFLKVQPKCGL